MNKKRKKIDSCESCEADFMNEVNYLVDNVEGYTEEDRRKKQNELEDAFRKESDDPCM